MFEELGIPVYYADERAKYLMQHEHFLIDEIKKNFGEEVYDNGQLNRQLLASKIFHDKEKVKLLNSLVHPAVFRDTDRWVAEQQATQTPYALKEAALLVESGSHKYLDKLIVVTAPQNLRLKRVVERDNLSSTDVMARIQNQLPEEEKVKLADFVIINDSDKEHLRQQVLKIHQQLVELSATK
jgi:dephospho-CoA kinase